MSDFQSANTGFTVLTFAANAGVLGLAGVGLDGEPTLHAAQAHGDVLKAMLAERFGIEHATLELECHDCESATSGLHASSEIGEL